MPVARLGGGNNFAIYWLNLVTLRTIRFWVEIQVEFLGSDVDLKPVLIWFIFSHVGFRTEYQLFILKVLLICIYTFWTVYTFCKITACISLLF